MDLQLHDKHALVTGASSGIGEGIARWLAEEGATVIAHGRDRAEAERVAQDIEGRGGSAIAVEGDLAGDQGARQAIEEALAAAARIDVLINNVGTFGFAGWAEAGSEDWSAIYNGNVVAATRMIARVTEGMKGRGFGRIIQIASYEAALPSSRFPTYAAAKAALLNLTVSLSKELAGTGITVNAVSPGLVKTSTVEEAYRKRAAAAGWGEDWAEIERHIAEEVFPNVIGRVARIEDVAALVAFLASPLAGYITGQNHRVDGGYLGSR